IVEGQNARNFSKLDLLSSQLLCELRRGRQRGVELLDTRRAISLEGDGRRACHDANQCDKPAAPFERGQYSIRSTGGATVECVRSGAGHRHRITDGMSAHMTENTIRRGTGRQVPCCVWLVLIRAGHCL